MTRSRALIDLERAALELGAELESCSSSAERVRIARVKLDTACALLYRLAQPKSLRTPIPPADVMAIGVRCTAMHGVRRCERPLGPGGTPHPGRHFVQLRDGAKRETVNW